MESLMALAVGQTKVFVEGLAQDMSLKDYILHKVDSIDNEDSEDPFCVVDLGRLIDLYDEWKVVLPRVHPFYAVKCNEDSALLKTLALLDTGFDCASKNEIKSILDLGVSPDRIIYANPCKQVSHLKYAARKEVSLMTFDNEMELHKVKSHYPTAKLVLRIRADDPDAICQLGAKFGCSVSVGKELLDIAKQLELDVVGVCFHVGSGCQTPSAFQSALELSSEMFQYGTQIGYEFTLLDIGGGFPGDKNSNELLRRVTSAINVGLDQHFSESTYPNLRIIAEPGRYFACSTHAIAVNVISKRVCTEQESPDGEDKADKSLMYYVNDGVYGSFNCILFDHVTPKPTVLMDGQPGSLKYLSSIWGPTCDGLDKICNATMPELHLGNWIYFDNMGAYTVSSSSTFNGFMKPKSYYYVTKSNIKRFRGLCDSITHEIMSGSEDGVSSASSSLVSSGDEAGEVTVPLVVIEPLQVTVF